MSLQFRIHTRQGSRSSLRGKSRTLLRSSEPPQSPLVEGNTCDAIDNDGRQCKHTLPSEGYMWCKQHNTELKDLSTRWRRVQKDADGVEAVDPDTAKQKTVKLALSVELRRQIRERFYPQGGDTADFLRWIVKLENDLCNIAGSLFSMCSLPHISTFVDLGC